MVSISFKPELSQWLPFSASDWLTVSEGLKVGVTEAIEVFIDFVLAGAAAMGE